MKDKVTTYLDCEQMLNNTSIPAHQRLIAYNNMLSLMDDQQIVEEILKTKYDLDVN